MVKYLYGAAVQGIQGFIFQTNKLQEIAGASELVERICTTIFQECAGINSLENNEGVIITAAGNIKYIFNDWESCQKVVRAFPMKVMEFAPGITISQAVVKLENGELTKKDIDELEWKLRVQRNKPLRPFDLGLMAMLRNRRTGLPAVPPAQEDVYDDAGTVSKLEIAGKNRESGNSRVLKAVLGNDYKVKEVPWDLKNITESKGPNYGWLAVVHADGNNLGQTLQKMADEITGDYGKKFREFSQKLDEATKEAANKAWEAVRELPVKPEDKYPIRPIVIGGDDLTIIIRADLALEFTERFLLNFEAQTIEKFAGLNLNSLKQGLTACAGIAYIKESYPFHYGYSLAETLCKEAKKRAKQNNPDYTPSCLMFHKVQSSFVDKSYEEIQKRELQAGTVRFNFGPYYLNNLGNKDRDNSIKRLQECVGQFEDKEGNAIKSHLRQWLTDLHNNKELAGQKMERFISWGSGNKAVKKLGLPGTSIVGDVSPVYDWLTINSINQGGN